MDIGGAGAGQARGISASLLTFARSSAGQARGTGGAGAGQSSCLPMRKSRRRSAADTGKLGSCQLSASRRPRTARSFQPHRSISARRPGNCAPRSPSVFIQTRCSFSQYRRSVRASSSSSDPPARRRTIMRSQRSASMAKNGALILRDHQTRCRTRQRAPRRPGSSAAPRVPRQRRPWSVLRNTVWTRQPIWIGRNILRLWVGCP
jgi:hypothetical protein